MSIAAATRPVLVPPLTQVSAPTLGGTVHTLSGRTMGTGWTVRWVGAAGIGARTVRVTVERELQIVIDQMSTWEPQSSLCVYAAAAARSWVPLPDALRHVLYAALQVAEASGGAFDPTAAPLVDLWGFGPTGRHDQPGFTTPGNGAVKQARARCGWRRLVLAPAGAWQPGGLCLDLSAIAKGHAVDRVCERLLMLGHDSLLVEIGGELRGHGVKPDGQPWWVAIEPPPGHVDAAPVVAMHGLAIATSGDYRRCWRDAEGRRRSHTIDPCSGAPVAHDVVSVSVLHAQCMWADAWSTALLVLGPEAGLALAERHALAARIVTRERDGGQRTTASPAWRALLQ